MSGEHLRITFVQRDSVRRGMKSMVLNDRVEVIDETGHLVADLSHFVRRIEVIDNVASARVVVLEMFAGEIAVQTDPSKEGSSR